jgi:DNA invertase Pin-like site-specific DNA recombinase
MAVMGYIRVSTAEQDVKNQRYEILEYANKHILQVSDWIEIEISSRKDKKERRIEELLSKLQSGDTLIVSELSRLGRSTSEVIDIVKEIIDRQISFVAIKQNLNITSKLDMSSKIIVTMFSLFAELERDIISERTKQALKAKKDGGKVLGKPRGTIQESILDKHKEKIVELLAYGVPKKKIAVMVGTSRANLYNYIKSRGLEPKPRKKAQS